MREIIVRNLTSGDNLKRDCTVTERIDQGPFVTTVVRRCTYRVESQKALSSNADSIPWALSLDPLPPREVHVTKDHAPDTDAERIVYQVSGHFYVVLDSVVYCVGYRHSLAMNVAAEDAGDSAE